VKQFKDRVAVVTGGASGIGRAMAERFGAEGMKVVLADVEEKALRLAEGEMREKGVDVIGVQTDVSKAEEFENLAQQTLDAFGGVHVVCNNAGVAGAWGRVWENTLDDWNWIMGVNLWGVIHGVRTFVPIMLEQGDEGHIVNTASLAGLMPGRGIYGVTKQGVVALSESLYNDLKMAEAKIGVSVLCPGWVNTNIADADRNRPSDLSKTVEPMADDQRAVLDAAVRNFLKTGLEPSAVADQVFEAIRDEKLYIITHPDMDFIFRERFEDITNRRNPSTRLFG
jgi:NAD(P)-dependent dehydrogenase (short-subunit alcohol dehydrogenase family)